MNFLQLQYFLSVCKNLSFKKASDELFVSQPAISKQIAALEKELNTKLILRSRGNFLSITPEGEEYRKAFASIMETMRNADNNVHNKIPLSKTICRVGVMEGWDVFPFFRKSKQDIHRLYDEIEVIFERKAPDELNHDMLAGTLDFVIYIDAAFRNQKNYEFHTIGSLRSILYAAADYKAIKNGKIDPASIGEDYYYITGENQVLPTHSSQLGAFKKDIRRCMVDTFSSIYTNVLTGTGFSIADELSFPMRSDLFHTEYLPNAASAVLFLSRRTDDARMKEVGRCLEERFAEILEEMAGIDKER